jgi:hypothetical protein
MLRPTGLDVAAPRYWARSGCGPRQAGRVELTRAPSALDALFASDRAPNADVLTLGRQASSARGLPNRRRQVAGAAPVAIAHRHGSSR